MIAELTRSEREQISEILRHRANEIAGVNDEYRRDEKHHGSVEFALSREIQRLRRLFLKIGRVSNGNHRRIRCNHRYQDWHIPPLVYRPRWCQAVGRYWRANGASMRPQRL